MSPEAHGEQDFCLNVKTKIREDVQAVAKTIDLELIC